MKNTRNVPILLKLTVSGFVVSLAAAYYFFYLFYLPEYKKTGQEELVAGLKNMTRFYQPLVTGAHSAGDDLLLLSHLEKIASEPSVVYARLVDNTGRVLAHNKINEWRQVLSDDLAKRIMNSQKPLVSALPEPAGYDYSIPVFVNEEKLYSFSVGISKEEVHNRYLVKKARVFNIFVILCGLQSGLLAVICWAFYFLPWLRVKKILNSILLGEPGQKINAEELSDFAAVAGFVENYDEKWKKEIRGIREKLLGLDQGHLQVLKSVSLLVPEPFIILDGDGKILSLNKSAAEVLSGGFKPGYEGKHFLEFFREIGILEAIKRSLNSPNAVIENKLPDKKLLLRCITVGEVNSCRGTYVIMLPF